MRRGFTIVELLIVVVVIAILAAITLVAYNGIQQQSRQSATAASMSAVAKAVDAKYVQQGSYPADLSSLSLGGAGATNLAYYPYSTGDGYCIESTLSDVALHASSADNSVRSGYCDQEGLVAWWPLNGNANDAVGTQNGTVNSGSLTIGANGQSNGGYQFAGAGNVTVLDSNTLDVTGQLTLTGWIKFDAGGNGTYQGVVSKLASSYELNRSSSNALRLEVICSGNHRANEAVGSLTSTGVWYFTVGTFDPPTGDITLYVNGQSRNVSYADAHVGCSGMTVSTTNVLLGARASGGLNLFGALDDVRIYNRVLTAGEISAMYARGAQ